MSKQEFLEEVLSLYEPKLHPILEGVVDRVLQFAHEQTMVEVKQPDSTTTWDGGTEIDSYNDCRQDIEDKWQALLATPAPEGLSEQKPVGDQEGFTILLTGEEITHLLGEPGCQTELCRGITRKVSKVAAEPFKRWNAKLGIREDAIPSSNPPPAQTKADVGHKEKLEEIIEKYVNDPRSTWMDTDSLRSFAKEIQELGEL